MNTNNALLFFFILLVVLIGPKVGIQAQTETEPVATLVYEGLVREYIVYTPPDLSPNPAIVLVLHGGSGNARQIQKFTDFDSIADKYGFMVVYPNGIDGEWEDGREDRQNDHDDVGFLGVLIDRVISDYDANPERVFVTGISNGGFMAYQLACHLSSRIAGIAALTSTIAKANIDSCYPEKPIAVLMMNGTADPLVPYEGGYVTVFGTQKGEVLSTDATLAFWVTHNRCQDTPAEVALPNLAPLDKTRIYLTAYTDCDQPVLLYRVAGGGHAWPGASQYLPISLIGRASRDINASEVIWLFFSQIKPLV